MVSENLGIQALRKLLHKDAGEILAFHQVLWHVEAGVKHKEMQLYLVCAKSEIILVDAEPWDPSKPSTDARLRTRKRLSERTMYTIGYPIIEEVIVHAQAEDRFGLVLSDDRPQGLPVVLQLSTCYRKQVVEAIEILHNTYTTDTRNTLSQLPMRFVGIQSTNPRQAFRHPAVNMFQQCPVEVVQDTKVFYRRGYMFLMSRHALDLYELLDNRPCSTYVFRDPSSRVSAANKKHVKAADAPGESTVSAARVATSKHMVVRFMPEKPVSTSEQDSMLEFQLFVENVAHAVAQVLFSFTARGNAARGSYCWLFPARARNPGSGTHRNQSKLRSRGA